MTRLHALWVLVLAVGMAGADPLPIASYRQLNDALRAASRPSAGGARFRLAHLFDAERPPELAYTELRTAADGFEAVLAVWGTSRTFKKGEIVQNVEILDVSRDRITARARGRVFPIFPRPVPPPVSCSAIDRSSAGFVARLDLRGQECVVRKGDSVAGLKVLDVTPERVTLEYLGVRGTFERFPTIACVVSRPPVVYVQDRDTLRPVAKGQVVGEARLVDVQAYVATFEYRDQRREFPCEPLPAITCTGAVEVEGKPAVLIQGEPSARRPGEMTSTGVRIERIDVADRAAGRVYLSFRGVPFDVPVRP